MRLQKFLRDKNVSSLRKCDQLVQEGKVKVNDAVVKAPTYYLKENDKIQVFDREFFYTEEKQINEKKWYLKFHKPSLVLSSHKSQKGRRIIFDIIHRKKALRNVPLFYSGRLDYDARGLMVLSNDGDFIHKLSHPSYEVEKEYLVSTYYDIDFNRLSVLSKKGYKKDDIEYRPFKFEKISPTEVKMILIEGKQNEIKNIIISTRNRVTDLLRTRIGNYSLGELPQSEIEIIK